MKIRALYPIFPPFGFDSDFSIQNYRNLIQYFSTQREIVIRGDTSHGGEKLLVKATKFTKAYDKHLNQKGGWKNRWMLEFSGSFQYPGSTKFNMKDHTGKIIPTSEDELKSYWKWLLPDQLDVTIQTYLLSLMIAFPGAVRLTDNFWLANGTKHSYSKHYKSQIHEGIEFIYKEGFKPRDGIKPEDVIDWVFKSNGIFNGYSDTPASRSLNFFTRLFVKDYRADELSDLVWAVAGVEALLVEGGRSSTGQLREKLTAIFKDRVDVGWLNKWVADTYNFRSRMIHGDRQIKSAFRDDDGEVDSRFYEEYHSLLFAVGILVMLLREVVARKIQRFQFMTAIKPA